ncbi:intradiol ring-cleavage dioxygenase [Lentzea sp. BCCO 10_0856]|uniref:Intradiol ring-cleavage dioxygenase n=1 Tax=Lentzea miocenica TaxID=3095431 RepID=A0ABU4TDZ8_9PSEU|nr:intradiol ring-cleavage dioxygenase [Lentzea sp. BCCO 10_0856]MDX8036386.1 intradiol ring-cleavage dioxygenase [Lentzea sp. BCCO 10_0856]
MTDNHDRGLQFDLATLFGRRRALSLIGGAGLTLVACAPSTTTTSPSTTTTTGSAGTTADGSPLAAIPEETAGPYPGDGSNGPNALTQSGIVRSDIRSSFGSSTRTAEGVRLTIELTVQNPDGKPFAGAAVYLWHCDINGDYSMYSDRVKSENFLRGVQEADSSGKLKFVSVFPGAYSGRWPHIHFEVYPTLAAATSAGNKVTTSQLALPETTCKEVYGTTGYTQSVQNMSRTSLKQDMVFRDGVDHQMATMSGNVQSGYTAALTFAVD